MIMQEPCWWRYFGVFTANSEIILAPCSSALYFNFEQVSASLELNQNMSTVKQTWTMKFAY